MTSRSRLLCIASLLLSLGCGTSHAPSRACASTADCSDDDACTIAERCDPATRTCAFETLDGDGDGEPPLVCGGSDCDDSASGPRCDDGGSSVDPMMFCEAFQLRVCARNEATGRIDAAGYDACQASIPAMCGGFSFRAGCAPTRAAVDECLQALVDISRLDIEVTLAMPTLPECASLCPR